MTITSPVPQSPKKDPINDTLYFFLVVQQSYCTMKREQSKKYFPTTNATLRRFVDVLLRSSRTLSISMNSPVMPYAVSVRFALPRAQVVTEMDTTMRTATLQEANLVCFPGYHMRSSIESMHVHCQRRAMSLFP